MATAPILLAALALAVPRPPIVEKPIPFGAARKAETAAYAQRHYGVHTWRLVHPHVIVEHYTVTPSFGPVWNFIPRSSIHRRTAPASSSPTCVVS